MTNKQLKPTGNNDNSLYTPSFEKNEFDNRIFKLNDLMNLNNLDLVLLFSPDLLYYFTGLHGWSFYTPQFLLLRINTFKPILVIREMDSPSGLSTTYLDRDNILAYPDEYVDNNNTHPIELLDKLIYTNDIIGTQFDSTYSRHRYFIELNKLNKNIVDISYQVNYIKTTKSTTELSYIRKAAIIADKVMQKAIHMAKPGIKISKIAAEIMKIQAIDGTYTGIPPMISVNDNSGHMNWNNSKLKKGDFVRIELSGAYLYYNCPLSRTIFIGNRELIKETIYHDSESVQKILELAFIKIIETIENNDIITAETIHNAFINIINKYGIIKSSRIGYSFGIGFPPEWQDGGIYSIRTNNSETILNNTTIHFIFGCGDGIPYGYSEAIIIKNRKIEFLCKTPRLLYFSDIDNYNFNIFLNNNLYIQKLIKYSPYIKYIEDWHISNTIGLRDDTIFKQQNTLLNSIIRNDTLNFHKSLNTYNETPLRCYKNIFGIKKLYIKDESKRLGGCSFKILGVSYAIHKLLINGQLTKDMVLCCTSDGNHGESLAYVCKYIYPFKCNIFLPKNISNDRVKRIKLLDASVFIIDKTYDETIEYLQHLSNKNNWKIISDQSWDGYEEIPRLITMGYTTMINEILNNQINEFDNDITHIFLQCGVGGMASSVSVFARNWFLSRNKDVTIIIVEPLYANCYQISLEEIHNGKNKNIFSHCKSNKESINIGLQCLIPSKLAFPLIRDTCDHYLCIGDNFSIFTIKYLHQYLNYTLDIAPTGISGIAGLLASLNNNLFNINKDSVVLTINTECNTDKELVQLIISNNINHTNFSSNL